MSRSHIARSSLRLQIDSSSYSSPAIGTSSTTSPPSSARKPATSSSTTPSNTVGTLASPFSVLCFFDFDSPENDHLSFHKNEMLEIVKQEDSGWWAAMRKGGKTIGWIPQTFVKSLTEDMAEKLRNIREELRIYEYQAEQLYNSVPISRIDLDEEPQQSANPNKGEPSLIAPTDRVPQGVPGINTNRDAHRVRPVPPPSPTTPMPYPTARPKPPNSTSIHSKLLDRSPTNIGSQSQTSSHSICRRPVILDDSSTLARLPPLIASVNKQKMDRPINISPVAAVNIEATSRATRRQGRESFSHEKNSTPHLWPKKAGGSVDLDNPSLLQYDSQGRIHTATLFQLMEKLTMAKPAKDDKTFLPTFLMTHKTFVSSAKLFDMLVSRFRMAEPYADVDAWRKKVQYPTQRRIIKIIKCWVEDHHLLDEEPYIVQSLTNLLGTIVIPPLVDEAVALRRIIDEIKLGRFSPITPISPSKLRKAKSHYNDILRIDALEIAEQLTLLEFGLYAKITSDECIAYVETQEGSTVFNLRAFCGTHDKLNAWVTRSILETDTLSRRVEIVDFWIKVAEKCRNLNNLASLSAITMGLTSIVISRLSVTWSQINRKSNLDALARYHDPPGPLAIYRKLWLNIDGPSVPFVAMFLVDLVRMQENLGDRDGCICFHRRYRLYEIISSILRGQPRQYNITPNDATLAFIQDHLHDQNQKDKQWAWSRSEELEQWEIENAHLRRGLEKAGF